MPEKVRSVRNKRIPRGSPNILILLAAVVTVFLIAGTEVVSHRNLSSFVSTQEKFILGVEAAILSILVVEMVVGLVTLRLHSPQMAQLGTNLRIAVRIAGVSYRLGLCGIDTVVESRSWDQRWRHRGRRRGLCNPEYGWKRAGYGGPH